MPKSSQVNIDAPVQPDMTPMIDVTFQLIIFFMCINTMSELERMAKVTLPAAYQALIEKDVDTHRLIVNIEGDGTIKVFNRPVTITEFKDLLRVYGPGLKAMGAESGDAPIVLRGDQECKYKDVKAVLSSIYEEGFGKIMFASHILKVGEEQPP